MSRLAGRPIDEIHGLPVLSTPVLLLDLARGLELVDLTAVVDGALRMEGVEAETVLKALPARAHGGPRLRRALAYCDPKAESPRETALRLVHTLAGITQVESQVNVGGADGSVGRADLWLVGTRRLVEYDGAEHRRKQRQRRDLVRDRKLHRTHWERYGYSDDDLIRAPGEILRDAEDALGLRHDPRRLKRWLAHARRSTLMPSGRRRLEHRLSRYVAAAARRTPGNGANLPYEPACRQRVGAHNRGGRSQGRTAVCRATIPPDRFRHDTRSQPAAATRAASTAWSGQALIDSAR